MEKPSISDRALHFRVWQLRKQYPYATQEAIASELQIPVWHIARVNRIYGTNWGQNHADKGQRGVTQCSVSTDAYMRMRPEYRPC